MYLFYFVVDEEFEYPTAVFEPEDFEGNKTISTTPLHLYHYHHYSYSALTLLITDHVEYNSEDDELIGSFLDKVYKLDETPASQQFNAATNSELKRRFFDAQWREVRQSFFELWLMMAKWFFKFW